MPKPILPPIMAAPVPVQSTASSSRPSSTSRSGAPIAVSERSVGSIRMVGAAQRFVLIEIPWNFYNMPLANGQELRCRTPAAQGGGQTALVRVGRERRQQFVVADVVSGQPNIGDIVFLASDRSSGSAAVPSAPMTIPLLPTLVPNYGAPNPPPAASFVHP